MVVVVELDRMSFAILGQFYHFSHKGLLRPCLTFLAGHYVAFSFVVAWGRGRTTICHKK